MKKSKKLICTIIILTIVLYSILGLSNNNIYAANETTNSKSTSSSNLTATLTKTSSSSKSSNANLTDLGIKPNDFTGFKMGTTTYNVTVPETVTVVEVYAKVQDSNATVTGTGSKSLSKGANALSVVVTAEDGTKKTYTINVTREGQTEGTTASTTGASEEPAKIGDGLSDLTIENTKLSPDFSTEVYEYTAKYIGTETKLNINAKPTNAYYTAEITGNDNIKEGENLITILVSDPDGANVATYQVTVNKSLVDEEAVAKEQQEKADKKQKLILICSCVGLGILVIIVGAILIHRRKVRRDNDYYYDDDYDDDYKYNGYNNNYKNNDYNDNYDDNDDDYENSKVKNNEENNEDEEENQDNIIVQKAGSSKEELKRKFLDNYNTDNYEDEDLKPKRKSKGKRFK